MRYALCIVVAMVGGQALAADVPKMGSYHTEDAVKLPSDRTWAGVMSVDIDPDGKTIWVLDMCVAARDCAPEEAMPVQKFDSTGKRIAAFGAGRFAGPHGFHVDSGGNFWVTDFRSDGVKGHTVMKFSVDGELLLTLGTPGVQGHDETKFNGPADVIVARNGDIFVADGHVGKDAFPRIVKFARDGTFIKAWGGPGSGPGQFGLPHALAFDSQGRLLVADRGNHRIQVFDQDGNYITSFTGVGDPTGLAVDNQNHFYVLDITSVDPDGKNDNRSFSIGSVVDGTVIARYPNPKAFEDIAVDRAGNIYVGAVAAKTFGRLIRN